MANKFLDFYRKNEISPVKQDISDLEKHIQRRIGLYRTLGLPPIAFKGARVLEVGAGSGHNSIVTAGLGVTEYIIVEPNETGYTDICENFAKYHPDFDQSRILNQTFEDFQSDQLFDIVICEGLIPGLDNKEPFIQKLGDMVAPGGVLVITCLDNVSIFFENARRHIAQHIIADIPDIKVQIEKLAEVFEPHLGSISGSTRNIRDWVADVLINPAAANIDDFFSISDAISFYNDSFYFQSSSPEIMRVPVWYKQQKHETHEYNKAYTEQFMRNIHNLIHYKSFSPERDMETNAELANLCYQFAKLHMQTDSVSKARLISIIDSIAENLNEYMIIHDSVVDISKILKNEKQMHECDDFTSAFGRGQQYISLVKQYI